ncbi:MAG TPA: M1 family metallopeptidase [Acidimicrobiales bacterium]|nr:M1 family metallopeptidase [Acidimicrobiales bacterium]
MHDSSASTPGDEHLYRLPRTVLPRRYDLTIAPDLDAATFRGEEAVEVEVTTPVDQVVLNAVDLDLDEAWVADGAGARIEATISLDAGAERATLALASTLQAGTATVHIRFRGTLNDKLKGFYRSTFTDEDGVERVIGTTQMEPTDARLAFPCWDEPDLKATFAVTLVVAEGLLAISNGGAVSESPTDDGRVAIRFAETIPMSTYLVAFVVGPLEATEAVDVDGIPLRVVHVPGKGHLAPYALEVGAFCLRYFADYYGIDYPGDKCDLIALPDFAAGAMENLGAITFREAVLLIDPDSVTQVELQRVADVVAHELAHMWFGDLVTMKWWNGLWLNEAFATFMELAAVDAFKPEWRRWVSFTNERAAAFAVDSLASTRPVEYPVHSPEDAEGMFDVLTYQKGASVLRMLEQYLGTDGFRAGIRRYLKANQFGNAETTDLWDAIEDATGEPVRRIMDSWIFQGGYPLVSASVDGDLLTLEQRRFRFLPDAEESTTWSVPALVSSGGTAHKVLLEGDSATFKLPDAAAGVVVNAGGHGFYRVRYSPALLNTLQDRLADLQAVERALLLEDTWAAVLAGDTDATSFLALAHAFVDETDRTVWATLVTALGSLDRILDGDARAAFQAFVRELVGPALSRLGWTPDPGEDELTRQLRGTLISTLGNLGDDPEVVAEARRVHDTVLADPGAVDPNVAAAVVGVVATHGGPDEHDAFWERYRTSPSPQESLRYLYALASFPDEDLVLSALERCLSGDIRSQNGPFLVLLALGNRDAAAAAWDFVTRSWDGLNERFPDNAIPRMLGGITALSEPALARRVEAFLAEHPVPQGARTVEQHLERLRVNVAFRQRESERVAAHLAGGSLP